MELEPGYKQTEVGVIPLDWEVRCLGEIATIATGSTPPTSNPANYGDEYLFVSPVDMGDKKFIERTEKSLSKKGFDATRQFPKGSILVVCIGSTIGKCGIASVNLTSNQQINAVFPSDSFVVDYLYYAICKIAPKIKAQAGEQAVPITNKSQFSETKVVLPPLPEQRAIAAALGDVDALLESLERQIAKQRDLKQAAMQQLLTGQTRLPGFEGEWKCRMLSDMVTVRSERIDPRFNQTNEFCVELENIEQGTGRLLGYSSTNVQSSLKTIFRQHDVLFGKLRAYLKKYWLATRDGVCSTEIWVLVSQPDRITSEYLYHLVTDHRFINVASTSYGTHMPRSDWNVVKALEIKVPTIDEQAAIAAVLSDMDAAIDALERRRAKTRDLKQAMMQELLTGRTRLV